MQRPSICFFRSAVFLCLFAGILVSGCGQEKKTRTFHAMGGIPVHIIVEGLGENTLDKVTADVQGQLEIWESELSMYRPDSAINHLNNLEANPVLVSDKTWEALQLAKEAEAISDGAFDITVGPIIRLWKNAEKQGVVPSQAEIDAAISYRGFDHLIMNDADRSVRIDPEWINRMNQSHSGTGIYLDVGGIAKGLFAQWMSQYILESISPGERLALRKLIIDLGGDMYVSCESAKRSCQVGIRDPFSTDRTRLWGILDIDQGAVVTSGTYERFFEIDGIRYNHIVNPATGRPIETNLVSVTIVDPSGAFADALATSVFVMGEQKGARLIESRPESEMILIRQDGTWFATDGLKKILKVL